MLRPQAKQNNSARVHFYGHNCRAASHQVFAFQPLVDRKVAARAERDQCASRADKLPQSFDSFVADARSG